MQPPCDKAVVPCQKCREQADLRLIRAGLRDFWCQVAIAAILTSCWMQSSFGDRDDFVRAIEDERV